MKDTIAYVAMIVAFATLVTAHVTIVFGLAFRAPKWRALASFFVPPLAPFWAYREKMHVRAIAFAAGAIVYVASRFV